MQFILSDSHLPLPVVTMIFLAQLFPEKCCVSDQNLIL